MKGGMEVEINRELKRIRAYYRSGVTRPYEFRINQLERLKQAMKIWEAKLSEALFQDLGKSVFESYETEIGFVLSEIGFAQKHLKRWMKPERVHTPLPQFRGKSRIYREPLGTVLIISPWNYPVQLALCPLVASIAAGNTTVLKLSELSPHTSEIVAQMLRETFPEDYLLAKTGGPEVSTQLLEEHFGHIFFTGSTRVGKVVCEAAAKTLTPVTLELGGKSPCIVTKQADVRPAAKRILWGKILNAGQTCVAPDYVWIDETILGEFVDAARTALHSFFPNGALGSPDYPHMINEAQFERVCSYMQGGKILLGGKTDRETLRIEPTLLTGVSSGSRVMQEEIFGPVLPILPYRKLEDALAFIHDRPHPLALYLFSEDQKEQRRILNELSFGGGCLRDTVMHLTSPYLPFGGIGASGMGAYHGEEGFLRLSHRKSVYEHAAWPDLSLRYPPYEGKLPLLKRLFK